MSAFAYVLVECIDGRDGGEEEEYVFASCSSVSSLITVPSAVCMRALPVNSSVNRCCGHPASSKNHPLLSEFSRRRSRHLFLLKWLSGHMLRQAGPCRASNFCTAIRSTHVISEQKLVPGGRHSRPLLQIMIFTSTTMILHSARIVTFDNSSSTKGQVLLPGFPCARLSFTSSPSVVWSSFPSWRPIRRINLNFLSRT